MKKNLLSIFLLLLCIGFIPSKTFAQADPGDDGNYIRTIAPPSYILNCKRNNGNGTSEGYAEVRLTFADKNYHNIVLMAIINSDGTPLSKQPIMDCYGDSQKGYSSYPLFFNIKPVNKLLFCFKCDDGCFWIPES